MAHRRSRHRLVAVVLGTGLAACLGCGGSHSGYVGTEADWAPRILVLDGDNQTAPVNTAFAKPMKVRLVTYDGRLMPYRGMTFYAPASGPSCVFPSGEATYDTFTDANGEAVSEVFTANGTAGAFKLQAGVSGVRPASVSLTNQ